MCVLVLIWDFLVWMITSIFGLCIERPLKGIVAIFARVLILEGNSK